jgi:hypothetical protein
MSKETDILSKLNSGYACSTCRLTEFGTLCWSKSFERLQKAYAKDHLEDAVSMEIFYLRQNDEYSAINKVPYDFENPISDGNTYVVDTTSIGNYI